jgi:hypothetical protein
MKPEENNKKIHNLILWLLTNLADSQQKAGWSFSTSIKNE